MSGLDTAGGMAMSLLVGDRATHRVKIAQVCIRTRRSRIVWWGSV